MLPLLKDPEPRVRFQAALALGEPSVQVREPGPFWDALVKLLDENADRDAYLRHAAARVMARLPGPTLGSAPAHPSAAVRLAAVLALRRQESPEAARFLDDVDPRVALEAARAVHDQLIPAALPKLAEMASKSGTHEHLLIRALNAHFILGEVKNARAIAAFAARADAPEKLRLLAVRMLGDWAKPPRRDYVTGLTQSLPERRAAVAADALRPALGGIFTGPDKLRGEAAKVAATLGIKEIGPALFELVTDPRRPSSVRVETLRALATLKDAKLAEALDRAVADADPRLRAEARRVRAEQNPAGAVALLEPVLAKGDVVEKQAALEVLGGLKEPAADGVLEVWLDKLIDGKVPAELKLDVLEAVGRRSSIRLKRRLASYEAKRPKNDPLANWRETLAGGDADRGRQVYLTKSEVSCVRCHKLNGTGGEVGPELAGIGLKQTREYLLESLVAPSQQIAKGYESLVVTKTDGKQVFGVLKDEDAKGLRLMTPEGQLVTVPANEIDERARGKSAMPEDLVQKLTKRELRDLVEFLTGLK